MHRWFNVYRPVDLALRRDRRLARDCQATFDSVSKTRFLADVDRMLTQGEVTYRLFQMHQDSPSMLVDGTEQEDGFTPQLHAVCPKAEMRDLEVYLRGRGVTRSTEACSFSFLEIN